MQRKPGVIIDPVVGSIAEKAGVQSGDVLLSIDTLPIMRPDAVAQTFSTGNTSYTLEIQRGNTTHTLVVMPEKGKIGVFVTPHVQLIRYQYSLSQALLHGIQEVYQQIAFSFRTF